MSSASMRQRNQLGLSGLVLFASGSLCLAACGGSGGPSIVPTPSRGTTPTPPWQPIRITLTNPAAALDMGQSEPVTATVTNDPSGRGVTWTIKCPTGVASCGTMVSAASASGAPDRFDAPANVTATEIVAITATSVEDPSKSVTLGLTVNPIPVAANIAAATGGVGAPFYLDLNHDVNGGTFPFSWSTASVLPAGITLDGATGVLSGIPSAAPAAVVLNFTATDSGTPPVPVAVSLPLTIYPQSALGATLSPPFLNFGCHWVPGSIRGTCHLPIISSHVATLTNTGSAPLNISSMKVTQFMFGYSSACPQTLGAGQSCAITIDWSPGFFGAGLFQVFDDAANSPQSIQLHATGNL